MTYSLHGVPVIVEAGSGTAGGKMWSSETDSGQLPGRLAWMYHNPTSERPTAMRRELNSYLQVCTICTGADIVTEALQRNIRFRVKSEQIQAWELC